MKTTKNTEAEEIDDLLKDEKVQDAIKLSSDERTQEQAEDKKQGFPL